MCDKCKEHCEKYVHLVSGRERQIIVTDQEIKNMGLEVNKNDLLDLLIIEKGNAAKIMIDDINLEEPKEIIYNRDIIKILFKDLNTDYYNRYDFNDLQQ